MAYLEIFLIQIILLILFLVLLASKNRQLLPWNWPFVRMMPTMYLNSHEVYDKTTEILAENNSTVLFKTSWLTKTDILVTSDPANAHHVMSSNFSIYQRGSEFRNVFDFLGQAVFSKDLEEWREEKKFTHAFFRENQYHESVPKIVHQTLEKALIPILDHTSQQNQELDLQSLFNRFMLDATCLLAAGFDPCSLLVGFPECPLLDAMDDIAEAVFYRHILPERVWKLQRWLRVGKEKKMAEASNTFHRILSDNVSKKKHELATVIKKETETRHIGCTPDLVFLPHFKKPFSRVQDFRRNQAELPGKASKKHIFSQRGRAEQASLPPQRVCESLLSARPVSSEGPKPGRCASKRAQSGSNHESHALLVRDGRAPEIWGMIAGIQAGAMDNGERKD
ncbi:UNVERIFIED_CONTAM: cytochrome [Sesamum latifolium]|uniref:Cytochrome n=1 Tax=Sesamum latifolium TaxID=2727402 RepID=A0AAW2XCF7_9LAMI